jgi:hypothetical protein
MEDKGVQVMVGMGARSMADLEEGIKFPYYSSLGTLRRMH